MTQEAKVIIGISIASIIILFGGVFFLSSSEKPKTDQPANSTILTRNANHKISSDSAKVTIVEFADFQCPACARTNPVLKQILEEYKGKLTFIYRHFPLPQHQNAIRAAKAAEAAGEQGKFWEMSDTLYDRQTEWSESNKANELFEKYASELQFDMKAFSQIIESDKYDSVIQQDKNDGNALGVNSTPTLFINSKKIEVALTYENLKSIIDTGMEKK